ncbi:MAG TPA: nicotinate-nicotinamide nucleotide adenylyltransferase [Gaiella sp.]|nr:nicotinate-nicotinamide nucleotide adenylyltransferase [Gaiella sp.]
MTVGILGGAFDPPHLGHVELARDGLERFALDRLLVRVVERPGHKEVSTAAAIRLDLARLAFAPVAVAEVSLDPFARTVDSLAALALPDPVFLVGADEFASFLTWKEPARVLELARLGVATRPGVDRARLDAVLAALDRPERVTFFPIDPLPISSAEIRVRVAAGQPIDGLVPPAVAAEIGLLRLYRRVETAGGGGMLGRHPSERTTPT